MIENGLHFQNFDETSTIYHHISAYIRLTAGHRHLNEIKGVDRRSHTPKARGI